MERAPTAEAAVFARHALELWEGLAGELPREPYYRRWLDKTCVILCAVGTDNGLEGEQLGGRAVELHQGLVVEFPGLPTHRYELAASWNWLGRHRAKAKRYADSSIAYGESLALFDRLETEFPNRPDYFGSAGDILANLWQLSRDRGDKVEGRRLWQEAKKRYRA